MWDTVLGIFLLGLSCFFSSFEDLEERNSGEMFVRGLCSVYPASQNSTFGVTAVCHRVLLMTLIHGLLHDKL